MTALIYEPVTPEQAAEHAAVLLYELTQYDAYVRASKAQARAGGALRDDKGRFASSPEAAAPVAPVVQLHHPGPDPAALAAGAGLTPAMRAALMASAKSRAMDIAVAVRSRSAHQLQRLTAGMSTAEWEALAITFAAAADPSRLLLIVRDSDDGLPAHLTPERRHAA